MKEMTFRIICNNCKKELDGKETYYSNFDCAENNTFDVCEDCVDEVCYKAADKAIEDGSDNVSLSDIRIIFSVDELLNSNVYGLLNVDSSLYLIEDYKEAKGILARHVKEQLKIIKGAE